MSHSVAKTLSSLFSWALETGLTGGCVGLLTHNLGQKEQVVWRDPALFTQSYRKATAWLARVSPPAIVPGSEEKGGHEIMDRKLVGVREEGTGTTVTVLSASWSPRHS